MSSSLQLEDTLFILKGLVRLIAVGRSRSFTTPVVSVIGVLEDVPLNACVIPKLYLHVTPEKKLYELRM